MNGGRGAASASRTVTREQLRLAGRTDLAVFEVRELLPVPEQDKLERTIGNTKWTPIKFTHRVDGQAHWLMRCVCGTEKTLSLKSYKSGTSLSCGCYRTRLCAATQRGRNRLPVGESARNQLLLIYKRGAAKRGIAFELSREMFLELTSADCHYCGSPPTLMMNRAKYIGKGNGAYVYNGIDRKDPLIGYATDNCVTACRPCNYAKGWLSYADFMAWLDRLVDFRTSGKRNIAQ